MQENFNVGDIFEFSKPKHILKLKGRILEVHNSYYRFIILESNKPHLINKTGIFQKKGNLINWINKL